MRTLKFVLFASLLAVASAAAPAGKIFPYPYVLDDLPNGLRLITIPTDFPNIVSVYIVVAAGSRNEVEPGKSGFAHLFEHLMFRGTPEFSPTAYQAVMSEAGASSNAFTSDDFTAFHTTFSKEDLPRILSMEADRFQHLAYDESAFKTETLAVLGEYNKNSANPASKLNEALYSTAFTAHTYRHTTMGFLADIQAMPDEYTYARQFFDRYYRPEYTTVIVAGDVNPKVVRSLIDERWSAWKRGSWKAAVPVEPAQTAPKTAHVDWPASTLPWVKVSWHIPAWSDRSEDSAALDAISRLAFDRNSTLYRKLVIGDQTVDALSAGAADRVDPGLFTVSARVKNSSDLNSVQQQILAAAQALAAEPVETARLEILKQHVRYSFALGLDDSESIADTVAGYIVFGRTPEAINRYYDAYARLTPADIRNAAKKYLVERNRTVVTLTSAGAPK